MLSREVMVKRSLLVISIVALILNISCKKSPTSSKNTTPTAAFTVNPSSGTTDTSFEFDASGCADNEDNTSVLQVRWDWDNDGNYETNFSTTKISNHKYDNPGIYTIGMEVKDSDELTDSVTKSVEVQQAITVIAIPDANFESLLRDILNIPTGDITNIDLATIISLDGSNRNISNIAGIEYCINLEALNLNHNQIIDISPLSGLSNLTNLYLPDNQIIDISALSGLTNLTYLDLTDNQIIDVSALNGLTNLKNLHLFINQIIDISALSGLTTLERIRLDDNQIIDISPLSSLPNLVWLLLGDNQIIDISALSGLTNLEWLELDYNQIIDISALSSLTNLVGLFLDDNQIVDIFSLIQNTGIDDGDEVGLNSNPLSDTSINTYIPELEARGVNVSY